MAGLELWLFISGAWRILFWGVGLVHGVYRRSILQVAAFGLTVCSSSVFLVSNATGRDSVPAELFAAATFVSAPIAALFVALMFGCARERNRRWMLW